MSDPATTRSIGRRYLGDAAAVTARPLSLSRRMTVEDAFRVTVLECLAHVAANMSPVVRARDVEGLHQLRVGLRRLHVAFAAFGEEFRTPALTDLRTRTKTFADAVAPARDLDVFIEELFEPVVAGLGHEEAFRILRVRAEEARARAWDAALAHVSGAEFAAFHDEVAAAAEARSWLGGADIGRDFKARLAVREPVRRAAPRIMDEHLMRVRKRGRQIEAMEQRDCHRLRIALKKLRYAAEFYGPLYRRDRVKRYLDRLKKLQDLLGLLNDVAQVRAVLGRLMIDEAAIAHVQADLSYAAGLINGWHHARAKRLAKQTLKRWEAFRRAEPFWA